MKISTATVTTENASRYLQQLCKHWGHRLQIVSDPHNATIDFGDGQTVKMVATQEYLAITILDEQETKIQELEKIVADHLIRFAHKENLHFDWIPQ